MPKEGKYFDYFNAHGDLIRQGGKTLRQLIDALAGVDPNGGVHALADEVDRLEREADKVTHELLSQLHSAFITPFDRDAIHGLINSMDDILDVMQDVAESLSLYDIQRVPAEACAMAEITEKSCLKVNEQVRLLNNMDNAPQILALCKEIDELEGEVDRLLRKCMSKAFREEQDVRELIKLKEIYQLLESVTDRCKDVAGCIEAIVLENS
ncbi:MAG: DUF47 domain-containing protein [Azonexus sp.]